jgi:hypothetical protein
LTKPDLNINGLSQSYNDFVINGEDGDCGDGFIDFSLTVDGVTNGAVNLYYSQGYGFYGYISNPGSNCDSEALNVEVTLNQGECSKLPSVTLFCSFSIRDTSESVVVMLPSPSAKKFEGSYYGGGEVKVDGSSIGSPYWVNNNNGKIIPISDDTLLTYTTYSTVNPGDDIPDLICYENCPDVSEGWATCSGNECKIQKRSSHLADKVQLDDGGLCVTDLLDEKDKLPSISFENIGGQPNVSVTWDYTIENDKYKWYVSFLALIDPGMDCEDTGGQTPSLEFTDTQSICESLPRATITCQIGNDYSDFRQVIG